MAKAYGCKRFPRAKVTVLEETLDKWDVTKKLSEMPFDQLDLNRAIAGDERAMQRLWSQHAPHIDAVVRRLCGDPELAADVSQEVWMQIFRALPSYRGDSQFGTWAHRIAVNRTLNALRKIKRLAKLETDIEDDSALIEMDTDRTFLAESIEQAMARLSPGARAVFVLHDIEGYTHGEIGEELGITPGGSKSQLFKARARLRRLLAHLVDESIPVGKGKEHVAPV
jgi:RNA polymerase sigma-70 factor, ECF subfamily